MNIKILFIAFLGIIVYFQLKSAPSNEKTLKSTISTYKELSLVGDYEKIIEYMYPKSYIAKLSKEDLLKKVRQLSFKLNVTELYLEPRLPVKSYEEGVYSIVTYVQKTERILPPIDMKNKDEKSIREAKMGRNMMLTLAKMNMNKGDIVDFDKESNILRMTKMGTMIFINENKSGWKFIDLASIRKKLLKKILHVDIINEEQELIAQTKDSMMLELFQKR